MKTVPAPMDRKVVYINGTKVRADEFGFDGCHKIYVVTSQQGRDDLESYGYDFYPIEMLEQKWEESCFLRFISDADLHCDYVPQDDNEEAVIR